MSIPESVHNKIFFVIFGFEASNSFPQNMQVYIHFRLAKVFVEAL